MSKVTTYFDTKEKARHRLRRVETRKKKLARKTACSQGYVCKRHFIDSKKHYRYETVPAAPNETTSVIRPIVSARHPAYFDDPIIEVPITEERIKVVDHIQPCFKFDHKRHAWMTFHKLRSAKKIRRLPISDEDAYCPNGRSYRKVNVNGYSTNY